MEFTQGLPLATEFCLGLTSKTEKLCPQKCSESCFIKFPLPEVSFSGMLYQKYILYMYFLYFDFHWFSCQCYSWSSFPSSCTPSRVSSFPFGSTDPCFSSHHGPRSSRCLSVSMEKARAGFLCCWVCLVQAPAASHTLFYKTS